MTFFRCGRVLIVNNIIYWCVVVVLVLAMQMLVGCGRVVTTGSFKGLSIGMTKEEVAEELVKHEVYSIVPHLDRKIVVFRDSDIGMLSSIDDVSGICVNDNVGFNLQIKFGSSDKPNVKYISIPARFVAEEVNALESRNDVLMFIAKLMRRQINIVAANCILDKKSISLTNGYFMNSLGKYDSWFYYVPDSYSTCVLRFSNGVLSKIEYKWRPFETP